jgi:hypothetical protein
MVVWPFSLESARVRHLHCSLSFPSALVAHGSEYGGLHLVRCIESLDEDAHGLYESLLIATKHGLDAPKMRLEAAWGTSVSGHVRRVATLERRPARVERRQP